jgi:Protein of unknown function DUF115
VLNERAAVAPERLRVMDYADVPLERAMAAGQVNVTEDQALANIQSSIRRGHPQIRPCPPKPERVCLVGSGPSLNDTLPELRALYFAGAHVVTVNGAYHWCLEHNIRPSTQIVLDGRPSNARFVVPEVPLCRYVLASQCAPEVWDAVDGREHVWIFHASSGDTGAMKDLLDAYYAKQWVAIGGGVTVTTRALMLLRLVGYLRFDLFGIDCCWRGERHHAFEQPENERDRRFRVSVEPVDHPELARSFVCSPWQFKQAEDFVQMIRVNGDHFLLNVHGDGLLAHVLASGADAVVRSHAAEGV